MKVLLMLGHLSDAKMKVLSMLGQLSDGKMKVLFTLGQVSEHRYRFKPQLFTHFAFEKTDIVRK